MGHIEDLYQKDDEDNKIAAAKDAIYKYNRDVDIIEEVIKDVLTNVEIDRPAYHDWATVKDDQSEETERYVAWVILHQSESRDSQVSLLSNGRLLYSELGLDHPSKDDYYIDLKHLHEGDSIPTTGILGNGYLSLGSEGFRIIIVSLAVEKLNVKARDNWLYQGEGSKYESPDKKIARLLSEILQELRQLRSSSN